MIDQRFHDITAEYPQWIVAKRKAELDKVVNAIFADADGTNPFLNPEIYAFDMRSNEGMSIAELDTVGKIEGRALVFVEVEHFKDESGCNQFEIHTSFSAPTFTERSMILAAIDVLTDRLADVAETYTRVYSDEYATAAKDEFVREKLLTEKP